MEKNQIRILIVDDDPTFSEVIRTIVTKAGFQAVIAKNPADALAANAALERARQETDDPDGAELSHRNPVSE